MTRPFLRLGLAALLLAAALPVLGEPEPRALAQAILQRWTYRDGLPHNFVHRLLAARSGYLWLGTQEGLVRFDGVRFKLYAPRGTPGLASGAITALLEDDRGTVWIGTATGLSRLEGDAFARVALGVDAAVSDLAPDGAGGVWVATQANGVLRVRTGRPERVERLEGLPDPRILALARDGPDLWIGGHGGLFLLADGKVAAAELPGVTPDAMRIVVARDGTVWVGTARGLVRRRAGAARFEATAIVGAAPVDALFEDRTGALWVGLESGPVARVRGGRVEAVGGDLRPRDARAFAEDADGDLWVGTESAGLHRLRWGQVVTFAREEGLTADVVWAVREGPAGVTWVATEGGLDRLTAGGLAEAHAAQLHDGGLAGLLVDRGGDLWVGKPGELWRFRARGGAVRYGPETGLTPTLARVIHEDARGAIRVGTSHGLFLLEDGRFRALERHPGLAGDTINTIAEGADGTLWVGTTTGLARVERERLVPAESAGVVLRGDVTALRAEPDGTLWIGTAGDGLARLSRGRLARWTQEQGLHEETVFAILDDGLGHLWLSGNHGLSRVARAELEEVAEGRRSAVAPLVLGVADGMRERECNGGTTPAGWRSADGRLWFATIRGVVVVDPARVQPSPAPPPVRIEEVSVDGRPLSPAGALRLAPGTRRVEVRYTGLSLAAAERIRFRHRLVGLDDGFVEVGGERVAYYTGLGPGRYVFEVAAASAAGGWGPPVSMAFEVEPRVWQTAWFAAAVALAALGLALGAHRLRTRALRRREAELAARVAEEMRQVKILRGLLPTCSWCHKIKDESGRWERFDDYVTAHTDAQFTHGMCPECFARMGGDGEVG